MTISQQASDVRTRARQASLGAPVFATNLGRRLTALNDDPQAVQIDDITVVAANDATYTITINASDSVFTADSSAATEEIRDGLIAAIEANPLARGFVIPTIKDADELTLTGITPGLAYTLAVAATGGSLTPASVQTAATADAVPFARLVIDDGSPDDAVDLVGRLAKSTSFVAQVVTVTIVDVAAADYDFTVLDELGAVLAQGSIVRNTDLATTVANILTVMNGLLPADSVVVTDGGGGDIVFTAELAGRQFSVQAGTNFAGEAGGAISAPVATTGPDNTTSVNLAALGVSLFSGIDPTTTIGGTEGEYAANAGMRVLASGNAIWVARPGAVSKGDPVFVELDGTGSDAGKFFTADSATRVPLTSSNALWERDGRTASDGLAAMRVGFGL
jgi:hypothetical protein